MVLLRVGHTGVRTDKQFRCFDDASGESQRKPLIGPTGQMAKQSLPGSLEQSRDIELAFSP
jgi:hypothetical protein